MKEQVGGLKDVAFLLNLSVERIYQLAKAGTVIKLSNDKYDMIKSNHGYIRYLSQLAGQGGETLTAARTRETTIKADILQAQLEKIQGSVVDIGIALEIWQGVLGAFKSKIFSASVRMRSIIENIKTKEDKSDAIKFLKQLHDEALNELSEIEAADYRSDAESTPDSEAAPEHDDKPVGGRKKAVKPRKLKRVRKVADKQG